MGAGKDKASVADPRIEDIMEKTRGLTLCGRVGVPVERPRGVRCNPTFSGDLSIFEILGQWDEYQRAVAEVVSWLELVRKAMWVVEAGRARKAMLLSPFGAQKIRSELQMLQDFLYCWSFDLALI